MATERRYVEGVETVETGRRGQKPRRYWDGETVEGNSRVYTRSHHHAACSPCAPMRPHKMELRVYTCALYTLYALYIIVIERLAEVEGKFFTLYKTPVTLYLVKKS